MSIYPCETEFALVKKQPVDVDLRNAPRRPFGVYVLVVILIWGVIAASFEIAQSQMVLPGFWGQLAALLRDFSGLVSLAGLVVTEPTAITVLNGIIIAVWLMVILGLWRLQRWAWLTVMIFAGVNLIYALFRYFNESPDYISMLVNVAVVFYLNDRSVQHAYARNKPGETNERPGTSPQI